MESVPYEQLASYSPITLVGEVITGTSLIAEDDEAEKVVAWFR